MGNDMNIINASCVYPEGIRRYHISIRNGIITKLAKKIKELEPTPNVVDASDMLVMPGMIDSHVHIRGGDFSYREDFYSGSRAAVSSGITTILEMPGCAKPASTLERFMLRVEEVKRDGAINFGLYGGAGADNLEEIPKLAKAGAVGYKTFQMAPVKGRETEFYGLCSQTYEDMVAVMQAVKKTGLTLTVHCEDQSLIDELTPGMQERYGESLMGFIESRPPQAEVNSILLTIKAAKKTGCRTIIAHVSAPESMKVIKRAQDEGVEIYAETCAHYLSFDKEAMVPFGSYARMKPPFRSRDEVEKMDRLFEADAFSVIGSDHAPFTKEEKEKNGADVWKSVDGLYGLELTLPLLLKLVEEKKADYKQIVRAFSENAAALFNLQGKGRIAEGKDADLVFVEKLDMPETFTRKNLLCKCKECAVIYDGISFGHKVRRTILGGRTVYLDGEVILTQGESKLMHY